MATPRLCSEPQSSTHFRKSRLRDTTSHTHFSCDDCGSHSVNWRGLTCMSSAHGIGLTMFVHCENAMLLDNSPKTLQEFFFPLPSCISLCNLRGKVKILGAATDSRGRVGNQKPQSGSVPKPSFLILTSGCWTRCAR